MTVVVRVFEVQRHGEPIEAPGFAVDVDAKHMAKSIATARLVCDFGYVKVEAINSSAGGLLAYVRRAP